MPRRSRLRKTCRLRSERAEPRFEATARRSPVSRGLRRHGGQFPQQNLVDAHAVHVDDLDLEIAPGQRVARLGNAAQACEDEACDGVIVATAHVTSAESLL